MLDKDIELQVSLFDSDLKEMELQRAIIDNLIPQIYRYEGVKNVDVIPLTNAPPGAKSISGYFLGKLKILVSSKNTKSLITWLSKIGENKQIEIQAKKNDSQGNIKEITVKLNNPNDLKIIISEINDFMSKY